MGTLNQQDLMGEIVRLLNEKADLVSHEEIAAYQKAHESALIEQDLRDLVRQRTSSELMLRICNFKPFPEGVPKDGFDGDLLRERFEEWFAEEEEAHLRQMCTDNIATELKKRTAPGDENLTFTEKFIKSVRERGRSGNTVNLMNQLKE